jgi:hypothetical protein
LQHVFLRAQVGKQRVGLKNHADSPLPGLHVKLTVAIEPLLAADGNGALIGFFESRDRPQDSRFAASGRPHQRNQLGCAGLELDVEHDRVLHPDRDLDALGGAHQLLILTKGLRVSIKVILIASTEIASKTPAIIAADALSKLCTWS